MNLLLPAVALNLVLQPAPAPSSAEFVPQVEAEVSAQAPKRSVGWILAAGVGMAALGAGIGGLVADKMDQSAQFTDRKNIPAINTGMAIGGLLGLIPGLLFGNEARDESQDTARNVILLVDVVGAMALGFGYARTHTNGS